MSNLNLVPISLADGKRFVGQHHRHNIPPQGWKWGVGLADESGELIGVALAGRPVSRHLDDGTTLEITRVCTLGDKNANSFLYGAISRAAKALGYKKLITYTLLSESGASLRAANFTEDKVSEAHEGWKRTGKAERPGGGGTIRYQQDLFGNERHPTEAKVRWVRNL